MESGNVITPAARLCREHFRWGLDSRPRPRRPADNQLSKRSEAEKPRAHLHYHFTTMLPSRIPIGPGLAARGKSPAACSVYHLGLRPKPPAAASGEPVAKAPLHSTGDASRTGPALGVENIRGSHIGNMLPPRALYRPDAALIRPLSVRRGVSPRATRPSINWIGVSSPLVAGGPRVCWVTGRTFPRERLRWRHPDPKRAGSAQAFPRERPAALAPIFLLFVRFLLDSFFEADRRSSDTPPGIAL